MHITYKFRYLLKINSLLVEDFYGLLQEKTFLRYPVFPFYIRL